MSVARTIRRRPGGDGASAASWSAGDRAPNSGRTSTLGREAPGCREVAGRPGGCRPLRAGTPARRPRSPRMASATTRAAWAAVRSRSRRRCPPEVDRERAALAGDHRRGPAVVAEQGGPGGRPRASPTWPGAGARGAERPGVDQEGQGQVGVDVALVDLVEDDQAGAVERRVALQAADEHPLGDDLDPRAPAHHPLVARGEAHGGAHLLAQQRRHPSGRGPGGQAPGLEHHDAPPAEPGLVEQAEGDDGRLARARRRLEDGGHPLPEGVAQVGDDLLDRETLVDPGAGHRSSLATARPLSRPRRR